MSNFQYDKCHKKVCSRCSLSEEIQWCNLFCYETSRALLKYAFELKHYHMVSLTRIQKKEMSHKSAMIFIYQAAIFNPVRLVEIYNINFVVFQEYIFFIHILKVCYVFFLFKLLKIHDESSKVQECYIIPCNGLVKTLKLGPGE